MLHIITITLPNDAKWTVKIDAVDAQAAKYKVLFEYVKVRARAVQPKPDKDLKNG